MRKLNLGEASIIETGLHLYEIEVKKEIQKIIDNDYYTDRVATLDWFPSNYCNYSCVMCAGGASSSRMSFENDQRRQQKIDFELEMKQYDVDISTQDLSRFDTQHIIHNAETDDFIDVINGLDVINFTGGETIMQKKVRDMIVQLSNSENAKNKTIFLLTNASSYPEEIGRAHV